MRFAFLGSGSAGNALIVEAGTTKLLLDCGFGQRETITRLARLGVEVSELAGILLTHEHDDHVGSAMSLAARYRLPVVLTHGTQRALGSPPENVELRIIDSHTPFSIGDMEIHPYPVPHDAREPVQYVFGDGARRLGVLTDAGSSTPHIEAMLTRCEALVLECNHDVDLLTRGDYPWPLKRRILSRHGHLDNASAANILSRLDNRKLQHLVAAHLSRKNNHPSLARSALASILGCSEDWIGIADQEKGLGWREIT
ncbi:MAG: MBL fold metallo-hydrolase [Methylophilaceae bacterium]|nr:MBL fold metallo-hydrolase [Methylophilaceae bacterium]